MGSLWTSNAEYMGLLNIDILSLRMGKGASSGRSMSGEDNCPNNVIVVQNKSQYPPIMRLKQKITKKDQIQKAGGDNTIPESESETPTSKCSLKGDAVCASMSQSEDYKKTVSSSPVPSTLSRRLTHSPFPSARATEAISMETDRQHHNYDNKSLTPPLHSTSTENPFRFRLSGKIPRDYIQMRNWLLDEEKKAEEFLRQVKIPLSATKKAALARFRNNGSIVEKCSICADNIKKEDTIVGLPCLHLFHSDCILNYLLMNDKCPLCSLDIGLALEL
eukprot:TRINITY_DN115_c0_g1_i1.p1 TRINITY_DN115_c0_g1~~TRINITY_DN115_c0_g1_i1.p1  ORF type:complete len:276 (-),score=26.51 TRINITY_DN115_c0_g1_i1:115-942(-)